MLKKILLVVFLIAVLTISSSGQVAAAESIVSTNVPDNATADNNARRLVRDSNGILYAAYYNGTVLSGVQIARSADNGASWLSVWTSLDETGGYPSLAVDSENNLHCVWVSLPSGHIYYKKYSHATGTWDVSPTDLGIAGHSNMLPAIVIDGLDNIHVVWEAASVTSIFYTDYTKLSGWALPAVQISGTGHNSSAPSIAVDPNNYVHVVYGGGALVDTIYLAKYTTSWVETVVSLTGGNPCIAIDPSDNLHVVYIDTGRVNYRRYAASWSSPLVLDDGLHECHSPTISVAPNGGIHVLWYNNLAQHNVWHHFSRDGGASWPDSNRAILYLGSYPSLRWSLYDNPNVFGSFEIEAEWIYTAPVASFDVKYDNISTTLPVGGQVATVNTFALLVPWIAFTIGSIAVTAMVLTKRKLFLG